MSNQILLALRGQASPASAPSASRILKRIRTVPSGAFACALTWSAASGDTGPRSKRLTTFPSSSSHSISAWPSRKQPNTPRTLAPPVVDVDRQRLMHAADISDINDGRRTKGRRPHQLLHFDLKRSQLVQRAENFRLQDVAGRADRNRRWRAGRFRPAFHCRAIVGILRIRTRMRIACRARSPLACQRRRSSRPDCARRSCRRCLDIAPPASHSPYPTDTADCHRRT